MRAPLLIVAIAFGIGIALCWAWKWSLLVLVGAVIPMGWFWGVRRKVVFAHLTLIVLVAACGGLRTWVDAHLPADAIAPLLAAEGRPITCEGVVVSDVEWVRPAQGPARRQGWLQINKIRQESGWVPAHGHVLTRFPTMGPALSYGDRLRLHGSVRGPRAVLNSRTTERHFNESQWLWLHNACGVLTISDSEVLTSLNNPSTLWVRYRRWVADFRQQLKHVGRSLLGRIDTAYLEALLLGDGQGIPREVWDAFRRVGVVHVLVVSGLHVGLIAAIGLTGLSLIRFPRTLRYFLVAIGLITYCLLTGSHPPILRSTLMGVLLCFGKIAGREVPALNTLGLAATLILAATPRALVDASFQLSFASVLGVFTLSPWFAKKLKGSKTVSGTGLRPEPDTPLQRWNRTFWQWIGRAFAVSCGAWVAITPFVAWHFHMFTPIALIANLIIVPWASLLIVIGFVLYSVGLFNVWTAAPCAASFSWMVYGLHRVVLWLAHIPYTSWLW